MSGPSSWRRAATVMLAAGWSHASPAGFRLLLLQRAQNQRFMPGAHVFPGGVLDAADSSPDWVSLFAPRHTPPRFGLGPEPPRQPSFPGLFHGDADGAALPDDVALRICAIRETFEEAGVLLLRPRDSARASQEPSIALSPPAGLADWRSRVRSDPRCFLQLCAHLDCTPDIWALHDWGGWLTPYGRSSRRFDTTFLLCCLRETPRVEPDLAEVVGYKAVLVFLACVVVCKYQLSQPGLDLLDHGRPENYTMGRAVLLTRSLPHHLATTTAPSNYE
eukprot:XP_008757522.1 PREDICTED: nucleoside diphosphate-linked moiety X motif 19-like [Rattus norvegicus]